MKTNILESLNCLHQSLAEVKNSGHECQVFFDWLNSTAQPRLAILFMKKEGQAGFVPALQTGLLALPERSILLDQNPEAWLKDLGETLPRGEMYSMPIIWREEVLGMLLMVSSHRGKPLLTEKSLVEAGLGYFASTGYLMKLKKKELAGRRSMGIQVSEEKYRTFVEQMPAAVYVDKLDGKGSSVFVSPQIETLFGIPMEEWLDGDVQLWQSFLHPDDREQALREYLSIDEPGQVYDLEYRIINRHGQLLWIADKGKVVETDLGERQLYGVMLDITERKLYEGELEAEAMLAQALAKPLDLKPLLERLLEAVRHVIPSADKGSVMLIEPNGNLRIRATSGYSDPRLQDFSFPANYSYSAQAMHERRGMIFPDVRADPSIRYDGEIVEAKSIQSAMAAPLMIQDQIIGVIALDSSKKAAFNEANLRLLVKFATSAAFILERSRLFEETQRRLTALEALYESGLSLSNLIEPHSIGSTIVNLLKKHMHWDHAVVRIRREDGDGVEVIGYGALELDEENIDGEIDRMNYLISRVGEGMTGWVIQHGVAVRSGNLPADSRYIETYPGILSGLYVPIQNGEHALGVIGVESELPNAFDDDDERFLSTLAAQASSSIENARLFKDMQKRLAELSVLHQSSQSWLVSGFDASVTYSSVHDAVQRVMPSDAFVIVLADDDPQGDYLAVYRCDEGALYPPAVIPYGDGLSGMVITKGMTLLVDDYHARSDIKAVHFGKPEHIRSILAIPMRHGDRTFGMISTQSYLPNVYNESHRAVLETIAAQFASSIENARLFEETRQRLRELETLQRLSAALRKVRGIPDMVPIFVNYSAQVVGAQAGLIFLLDEASNDWVSNGWITADGEYIKSGKTDLRTKPGDGLTGRVGERGELYIVENARNEPLVIEAREMADQAEKFQSGIILPIRVQDRVIGVMQVWHEDRHVFTESEKHLLIAIADIAGSSLQRARLHEETNRQLRQLTILRDMDRVIASSFDLQVIFNILFNYVTEQLDVDAVNILLYNPHTHMLERVAGRGFLTNLQNTLQLRLGESFAGRAALERRVISVPDLSSANGMLAKPELLAGENFKAYYAHPLVTKGEILGVLEVFNRSPLKVTAEWLNFFETISSQAAIAVDNSRLFENLERSNFELTLAYDKTIEGWSKALDLRDRETEGHTRRVTDLTLKLAKKFGLSGPEFVHIRRGALLHDIGKIGIPDHILLKPGNLTDEEWIIMRQHPQHAYDMLSSVEYLRPALDIPYCHHEKWDGTGYPRGLKGEEIPFSARIFAIADVYDALTSHRPYRLGWSKEQTVEFIRTQSGKHFDPNVVEVFLKTINELKG
ncbi:MAG TPA: GAF domain-containing protein [Anaerolineales bacterium]|nr:GAF domain-containing protein [Anaerolineales bacterium]